MLNSYALCQLLLSAGRGTRSSSWPVRLGSAAAGTCRKVQTTRPRTGRRRASNWPRSDRRGTYGARAAGRDRAKGGPITSRPTGTLPRPAARSSRTDSEPTRHRAQSPATLRHRARAAPSRSGWKSERARRAGPAVSGVVRPRDALWARLRK